jgi:hypothetical protein
MENAMMVVPLGKYDVLLHAVLYDPILSKLCLQILYTYTYLYETLVQNTQIRFKYLSSLT